MSAIWEARFSTKDTLIWAWWRLHYLCFFMDLWCYIAVKCARCTCWSQYWLQKSSSALQTHSWSLLEQMPAKICWNTVTLSAPVNMSSQQLQWRTCDEIRVSLPDRLSFTKKNRWLPVRLIHALIQESSQNALVAMQSTHPHNIQKWLEIVLLEAIFSQTALKRAVTTRIYSRHLCILPKEHKHQRKAVYDDKTRPFISTARSKLCMNRYEGFGLSVCKPFTTLEPILTHLLARHHKNSDRLKKWNTLAFLVALMAILTLSIHKEHLRCKYSMYVLHGSLISINLVLSLDWDARWWCVWWAFCWICAVIYTVSQSIQIGHQSWLF